MGSAIVNTIFSCALRFLADHQKSALPYVSAGSQLSRAFSVHWARPD
jgi:hypothetical protein